MKIDLVYFCIIHLSVSLLIEDALQLSRFADFCDNRSCVTAAVRSEHGVYRQRNLQVFLGIEQ